MFYWQISKSIQLVLTKSFFLCINISYQSLEFSRLIFGPISQQTFWFAWKTNHLLYRVKIKSGQFIVYILSCVAVEMIVAPIWQKNREITETVSQKGPAKSERCWLGQRSQQKILLSSLSTISGNYLSLCCRFYLTCESPEINESTIAPCWSIHISSLQKLILMACGEKVLNVCWLCYLCGGISLLHSWKKKKTQLKFPNNCPHSAQSDVKEMQIYFPAGFS